MAAAGKRTRKSDKATKTKATNGSRKATAQPTKKIRVIEAGSPEQEGDQITGRVSDRERDEYRHGGIPLGSDPRE